MADTGISSIKSGALGASLPSRSSATSDSSSTGAVSGAGSRSVRGQASGGGNSSQRQAAPRPVVNIDGQSMDRGARRGTYLNILV